MSLYTLTKKQWMQIFAAWIGWLMDGFTSIAYALVATTISKIFLPSSLGNLGLAIIFAGFAVGAIARPFGSLIFGNYLGDRLGRKNMLMFTILGFTLFAGIKGFLPTFDQVGYIAPILLYIILFVEGMFAGAEYGGGTVLAIESIPSKSRGFIGAFVQSGFGTGYFLISFIFAGIYSLFPGNLFLTIGWRVFFWILFIPGILAFIIRYLTHESPIFEELAIRREVERTPILKLFKEAYNKVVYALLITTGLLFINTATFSFYPAILQLKGFNNVIVGTYVAIINFVSLLGVWLGGFLVDRIKGRKKSMFIYAIIFAISIGPLTYLGYSINALFAFSLQAFLEAMIFASLPSFLAESFSKRYRTTAVGFTYNGGAIIGSLAVTIIFLISDYLGLLLSWIMMLYLAAFVMIIGILLSRETWKDNLDSIGY
ncbi:MAG: MFS transporter [Thermoproteota archaeon]|jgi:MFS family permease